MPGAVYALFRNAILGEQQIVCNYTDGRIRKLCPHIIGTNKWRETASRRQFAGESSGPLPQWRCLKLAGVSNARTRQGRWHEGGSHRTTQNSASARSISTSMYTFASCGDRPR